MSNQLPGRRLKILMSAYACEPGRGSEPGVGWNMALEMSKYHDVWVITRKTHKAAIESYLKVHSDINLNFIYFDFPAYLIWWQREQRGIRTHYYFWQLFAYFPVMAMHKRVRFDIGHHVTYVMYWMPSFLAFMNIPYVLGPVGGGEAIPRGFLKGLSIKVRSYEYIRLLAKLRGEYDPLVRLAVKRASVVYASTPETAERIKKVGMSNVKVQASVAININEIEDALACHVIEKPRRVVAVQIGRLVTFKGFNLGIKAIRELKARGVEIELKIIGDGPERHNLEREVRNHALDNLVEFCGDVDRSIALKLLSEADVLLQMGLHESGGFVVLEAMSLNKPVIALDTGGQSLQIDNETGKKISVTNPDQVISDIADALFELVNNKIIWIEKGKRGKEKLLNNFTWSSKGTFYDRAYQTLAKEKDYGR